MFTGSTHSPDVFDETLDRVGHGVRVTGQNRPCGRVFGVDHQRAGGLEQAGRAVEHGTCRLEDRLLGGKALQ